MHNDETRKECTESRGARANSMIVGEVRIVAHRAAYSRVIITSRRCKSGPGRQATLARDACAGGVVDWRQH